LALENRDRVDQRLILPTVNWREASNKVDLDSQPVRE
jgi:hypothetical protein